MARTVVASALVACALALVGMTGSVRGTFAFWTDDASLRSSSLTAGTLDLTLDGNLAGIAANGGVWTHSTFGLDAMLPGESRAASVSLRNEGTAPLAFAVTGSATGGLAPGLRFSLRAAATPVNVGAASAGNRAGSCQGGTPLASDVTLTSGTATVAATDRVLVPGASEVICLVVRLAADAPNSLQGTSATALLTFSGRQVGAT